jgi:hypothetical protein
MPPAVLAWLTAFVTSPVTWTAIATAVGSIVKDPSHWWSYVLAALATLLGVVNTNTKLAARRADDAHAQATEAHAMATAARYPGPPSARGTHADRPGDPSR